uniref:Capsid protein n=1 Tax=Haemonchus placei TaxID=6290 RepID=A0A0N4WRE5_HAEPC
LSQRRRQRQRRRRKRRRKRRKRKRKRKRKRSDLPRMLQLYKINDVNRSNSDSLRIEP